ncbi:hypothetical protein [Actinoplanes sp. NPDC023714]|uniref:TetR/AcrR family transcriptional regulator n=1 Tax=Actinoplanes sp. NPDC023714 TaxID=3154322 RepID=UPI0033EF1DD4
MSSRQDELLEAAYRYVLANGLADLSLRPLAAAIGSSPRVLLFLFGSKDGLIRALLARARAEEMTLLASTSLDPGNTAIPGNAVPGNTAVPGNGALPGNTPVPGNTAVPGNTVPGNTAVPGNAVPGNAVPGNTAIPRNAAMPGNAVPGNTAIPGNAGADGEIADSVERIWVWLAAPEHRPLLRLWTEAYARSLVEPDGPWGGFARSTVEDWLRELPTLSLAVLRGALLDLLATGDEGRVTAAVHEHIAALRAAPSR